MSSSSGASGRKRSSPSEEQEPDLRRVSPRFRLDDGAGGPGSSRLEEGTILPVHSEPEPEPSTVYRRFGPDDGGGSQQEVAGGVDLQNGTQTDRKRKADTGPSSVHGEEADRHRFCKRLARPDYGSRGPGFPDRVSMLEGSSAEEEEGSTEGPTEGPEEKPQFERKRRFESRPSSVQDKRWVRRRLWGPGSPDPFSMQDGSDSEEEEESEEESESESEEESESKSESEEESEEEDCNIESALEPAMEPDTEWEAELEAEDIPAFIFVVHPVDAELNYDPALIAPPDILIAHLDGELFILDVPRGEEEEEQEEAQDIAVMTYNELLQHEDQNLVRCEGLAREEVPRCLRKGAYVAGDPEDLCVLCMEKCVEGAMTGSLGCGHKFHWDCIAKWLHVRRRPTCPLCKAPPTPLP